MKIAVVSASSDIGHALAAHWVARGDTVAGTYRTLSPKAVALQERGVSLIHCDLDAPASVTAACARLAELAGPWDALVVCPATLEPIGEFADGDFDAWAESLSRNFVAQMRCIHALLPSRNREAVNGPCVIAWAGSGTNSAPRALSAYTISKIAQTKMMELLDAEVPDARFVTVGPGWVRTKIHDETMRAGQRAGVAYDVTVGKLTGEDASGWTQLSSVVACCDWLLSADRNVVGGRNFSVAHDAWGTPSLTAALLADRDMYKLRRHGNAWRPEV